MKPFNYKRLSVLALLTIAIWALSGCGKPLVGRIVDTSHETFCRVYSFPAECTKDNYEHFLIHAKIEKLDDNGNYEIKGYFDPTQGSLKSWDTLKERKVISLCSSFQTTSYLTGSRCLLEEQTWGKS